MESFLFGFTARFRSDVCCSRLGRGTEWRGNSRSCARWQARRQEAFGHIRGGHVSGEGWKLRGERQNPNRESCKINIYVLFCMLLFPSFSPWHAVCLLGFVRVAVGRSTAGSAARSSCLHPEDKAEGSCKTTAEMQGEQARALLLCLFNLTLSLNIRSFYSLLEGCQAEEVTLRRKELARTVQILPIVY